MSQLKEKLNFNIMTIKNIVHTDTDTHANVYIYT